MGIFITGVGTNSFLLKYNGVDLTNHVQSVTINQNYDDIDITPMGSISKQHAPGLRDDSADVTFFNDYGTTSVDATIFPFLGSATGATLLIQTSGSTVSATQPSYTMVATPYTYSPIDGTVGTASMNKVTFKPAAGSVITRGTS